MKHRKSRALLGIHGGHRVIVSGDRILFRVPRSRLVSEILISELPPMARPVRSSLSKTVPPNPEFPL